MRIGGFFTTKVLAAATVLLLVVIIFSPAMGYTLQIGERPTFTSHPGEGVYYSIGNGTPAHEITSQRDMTEYFQTRFAYMSTQPYSFRIGGRANYSVWAMSNATMINILGSRKAATIAPLGMAARSLGASTVPQNATSQAMASAAGTSGKQIIDLSKVELNATEPAKVAEPAAETTPAANATESAADLLARGRAWEDQGRLSGALAAYERALASDANNKDALLGRARVLGKIGRYIDSLSAYEAVINLDPEDAEAWTGKADMLRMLGREAEALAAYDRALELDPNNMDAWLDKARVLEDQGNFSESLAAYDRVLALDANNKDSLLGKARVLGKMGSYNESLNAYEGIITLDSENVEAWLGKASALESLGYLNDSLAAYDRALELNPNDKDAWLAKARVLRAFGRDAEADTALARANELAAAGTPIEAENASQAAGKSATLAAAIEPTSSATGDSVVRILGLDATSFPKIRIIPFINTSCARAGGLSKDDFKVSENGQDVGVSSFYFSGNASGQQLDLAVVFDETGSMGEEIDAMKSRINRLIKQLNASGLDARYALASFSDRVSVKSNWTNDPDFIYEAIDSLKAFGGDDEPEASLDAIGAVLSMGFRPDAQKIILVVTDAHAHEEGDGTAFSEYTQEEIAGDLKRFGVVFMPISKRFETASKFVDIRDISNQTQSTWTDLESADFSTLLERFEQTLTGTYVIKYESRDAASNTDRTVMITIDKPECVVGSGSSSYASP